MCWKSRVNTLCCTLLYTICDMWLYSCGEFQVNVSVDPSRGLIITRCQSLLCWSDHYLRPIKMARKGFGRFHESISLVVYEVRPMEFENLLYLYIAVMFCVHTTVLKLYIMCVYNSTNQQFGSIGKIILLLFKINLSILLDNFTFQEFLVIKSPWERCFLVCLILDYNLGFLVVLINIIQRNCEYSKIFLRIIKINVNAKVLTACLFS